MSETASRGVVPEGIHHVTMIAGDPQRNVDFYAGVLGMRLVKKTINFDDPGTYHLYYGDETGTPGTLLTFFPWPHARRGREGAGQFNVVSLAVPSESLGWWVQRLVQSGVEHEPLATRFGERLLAFRDPDGLRVELVGSSAAERVPGWSGGPVPAEHAIRGVHAVTLWSDSSAATFAMLENSFGMTRVGTEQGVTRWRASSPVDDRVGTLIDVRDVSGFWEGAMGAGTVHHVAWRVPDDASELALRERILAAGLGATPVIDRKYFHSVYFREPSRSLFEIATDVPGFAVDEPLATLGESLVLPPWLESERERITAALPPIHHPSTADARFGELEARA
ncbi:MAG: ring-cleaving dioxygenase [Gemmatimonadaceae bacterium]|nr:ring-cleaving dioxygenase [Gemmatimonadaceae bacterium]NUQ91320.1 ring-cleaving dioxygenase [Gemmatimonadaceae bacterium]NUR20131.1 ring-cleaving dioxygenase [Gemmatimonadaceae bacterium]NUS96337.1 ring-cleaving dioxygenase [Gemmatimonadaceae bacterium]